MARFGLASLLPILLLGIVLSAAVRDIVEERMLASYAATTDSIMGMFAGQLFTPEDFEQGVDPAKHALLRDLMSEFRLADGAGVLDARLVNSDGIVIYAGDEALIGTRTEITPDLQRVLAGERVAELVEDDGSSSTMRLALPVEAADSDEVIAAAEIVMPDHAVVGYANFGVWRIRAILGIGLGVLWLALVPIAARASSQLRRQADENRHMALHDSLTGLPNRNLLVDRLDHALSANRRSDRHVGLLLIDLDRFKEVNDSLGHAQGDVLLRHVAARLLVSLRPGDTVARLGGDEFAVVVHEIDGYEGLAEVAARVTEALERPFEVDGLTLVPEASIGIASSPTDGDDAPTLLQRADVAMYAAKAAGAPYAFYAADADVNSPSRLSLVGDLRHALDAEGQLVLYYQPLATVETRVVQAMEALVRWEHPTLGLLPPIDFIPLAEHSGLIRPLTSWVLDHAIAQCAQWRAEGIELVVAVNLSGRNLREPDLPAQVAGLLERHGVPASSLELEITESALMSEPALAMRLLSELSELGVRLALDDFGTGYSSLAYLRDLPADELKIDRRFVAAMLTNAADASIVQSVIDLAHNLGMRVTAEGVETEAAWSHLATLDCDQIQGYHLARPAPPDEAIETLRRLGSLPGAAAPL